MCKILVCFYLGEKCLLQVYNMLKNNLVRSTGKVTQFINKLFLGFKPGLWLFLLDKKGLLFMVISFWLRTAFVF